MIRETITIDDAVEYLNSLVEADPVAMRALLCNVVPCNCALADHPSAQVGDFEGAFTIGLMGVLAGLFGINDETGMACIAWMMRGPDDEPENPRRLIGFCKLPQGEEEG